ncbi:hypothetical protein O1Q80_01818 [Lonepinella sp. MS14435]
MKKITFLFTALFVFIFSNRTFATERWINCRVVSISDGDSITCLLTNKKQIKVRLAEIDAPEKAQAFGKRAKQTLAQLIHKTQVRLKISDYDPMDVVLRQFMTRKEKILICKWYN